MIKTLIVDGNNLLKIGVCGVKDFYNNGEHVGGIWHFLNTIRKFLEENSTVITQTLSKEDFSEVIKNITTIHPFVLIFR